MPDALFCQVKISRTVVPANPDRTKVCGTYVVVGVAVPLLEGCAKTKVAPGKRVEPDAGTPTPTPPATGVTVVGAVKTMNLSAVPSILPLHSKDKVIKVAPVGTIISL